MEKTALLCTPLDIRLVFLNSACLVGWDTWSVCENCLNTRGSYRAAVDGVRACQTALRSFSLCVSQTLLFEPLPIKHFPDKFQVDRIKIKFTTAQSVITTQ